LSHCFGLVFMKKFILSALLILFIIMLGPYILYFKIVRDGIESDYLTIRSAAIGLAIDQKLFESATLPEELDYIKSLWRPFHFINYSVLLPVAHPEISLVPIVKKASGERYLNLGFIFTDVRNKKLFSFQTKGQSFFETFLDKHKLFNLPLFRNYIMAKDTEEIWNDLFTKDLALAAQEKGEQGSPSLLARITKLWGNSYRELVYDLFIYNLRINIFPSGIKKILYFPLKKLAAIEIWAGKKIDSFMKTEEIFILVDKTLLRLTIETDQSNSQGGNLRNIFLVNLAYKEEAENSFGLLYDEFRGLPIDMRKDQVGMIYLMSAWSHNLLEKKVLQEIIFYLEKGRGNFMQLDPFYQYAYEVYGDTLSSVANKIDDADVSLKKKILEELDKETSQEKKQELLNYQGNFDSSAEKVEFYLRKAKGESAPSDNNEDKDSLEENTLYGN